MQAQAEPGPSRESIPLYLIDGVATIWDAQGELLAPRNPTPLPDIHYSRRHASLYPWHIGI